MQITPLGETTAAAVTGVDLKSQLDAKTKDELNAALVRHVALVFPDQQLSPPELASAVQIFGEIKEERYKSEFGLPRKICTELWVARVTPCQRGFQSSPGPERQSY